MGYVHEVPVGPNDHYCDNPPQHGTNPPRFAIPARVEVSRWGLVAVADTPSTATGRTFSSAARRSGTPSRAGIPPKVRPSRTGSTAAARPTPVRSRS